MQGAAGLFLIGAGSVFLIHMNLVLDDFKFRLRSAFIVENVVSRLKLAFEQADGGALEGAVPILVI